MAEPRRVETAKHTHLRDRTTTSAEGLTVPPEERAAPAQPETYEFIDRMRGIAILMVIAVHYSQNFVHPAIRAGGMVGQFGVQLFFVASAVTLCLSADRHRREPHAIRNFYIRRWFRVAPLYYFGVGLYWAIFAADGRGEAYTAGNIAANLGFIHGFVPSANNTIVPGGWSVAVEMTFYLLFPVLYDVAQRLWRIRGLAGVRVGLGVVFAGLLAFQLAFLAITGHPIGNSSFAYFFFANQFPVFAMAMAWHLAVFRGGQRLASPGMALACFGGLIALCGAILDANLQPLFGVTQAIAALAFLCLAEWLRGRRGNGRLLAEIGKVSYSLYVLHFALVWWPVRWIVATLHGNAGAELALLVPLYLATVAVLFAVARLSKRYVEDPGTVLGRSLIRRLATQP